MILELCRTRFDQVCSFCDRKHRSNDSCFFFINSRRRRHRPQSYLLRLSTDLAHNIESLFWVVFFLLFIKLYRTHR